uniref:PIPK domain-containing protein n=1 Tax=Heterorhabditis bacteriophora TaxID=37862 RepID=A0A1I7XEE3_HETBA
MDRSAGFSCASVLFLVNKIFGGCYLADLVGQYSVLQNLSTYGTSRDDRRKFVAIVELRQYFQVK